MTNPVFMGLVYNAALLLALTLLFDLAVVHQRVGKITLRQLPIGIIIGGIGIAVMLTRWELLPGAVFDTRSVLLSISGLFFGTLPTLIAILMTAAFRIYDGGVGALTGTLVILATGGIGIITRRLLRHKLLDLQWWQLYLFGLLIHLVMLALMFTFPWEIALQVLTSITLPVLLIYPLATMLLGMMMVNRSRRESIQESLAERERELQRINRALHLISDCNKQLVRSTNEQDLLEAICRVIVEAGGYRMAWVGYPQMDKGKSVLPVASAGEDNGYLETVRFHWGEDATDRGLTGESLRTRQAQVSEDTLTDPRLKHVWEEAEKRGFGSLISLPLIQQDELIGTLTIHSGQKQAFSNVEVALLSELAADLAYGILALRQRSAHAAAQAEVISQARFPDENPNPVLRMNTKGEIIYFNAAAREILPVAKADQPLQPERLWVEAFTKAMEMERPIQQEWHHGSLTWMIAVAPFPKDGYANLYFLDVTQLHKALADLSTISNRQEAMLDAVPVILMEVDVERRYTWANSGGMQFFGDDVLGKEAAYYFEGEQDTYQVVEPLFTGSKEIIYVESWQRREDGQKRLLAWWCRTLRNKFGEVTGVLSSAQDITEQRKAEEKIQESEVRWRGVFEKSTIGKSLTGVDGKIIQVNPAFANMLGYSLDEMQGIDFGKITHAEDIPASRELIRCLVAGDQETYRLEKRYIRKDGNIIWTDLSTTLLRDEKSNPRYFITSIVDITERKTAEEALRLSKERLTMTLEAVNEGVWDWHIPTGEAVFSPSYYTMLGFKPYSFPQNYAAWKDLVHPDDLEEVESRIDQQIHTADHYELRMRLRTKSGEWRWIQARGHVIEHDEKGNPLRLAGTHTDITEQKQVEDAVRVSEARYRNLVETQSDIIARSDLSGNLTFVNDAYCKVFGKARDEVLGKPFTQMVLAEDLPISLGALDEINQPPYRILTETRHETTSGLRWYAWENSAVLDEAGSIIELQGVGRDITDRKNAEDAIHKLNLELEERVAKRTVELAAINKELETFAYSVSHDLKAPLRGIDGYSRLLLEEYGQKLDDEGRKFLSNIRTSSDNMNRLIEDLLAYSRMERQPFNTGPVDLNRLLDGILREREEEIRSRKIKIIRKIRFETVLADADGLSIVMRNLIDNAFKFTTTISSPQIEIGGEMRAGAQVLWVRDNGVGFEMKYAEKIFEIFQRLHRAEEYPGTGIGLAMVRKAMHRLGGRTWAESTPGKGAVFYLEMRREENDR